MSTPLLRCAAGVALALAAPVFAAEAPRETAMPGLTRAAPVSEVLAEIGVLAPQTRFELSRFDHTRPRSIRMAPPWRLDVPFERAALDRASPGVGATYRF